MNEKKHKSKIAKGLRKDGCPWEVSWLLSRWKVAEAISLIKQTYEIKLVGQTKVGDTYVSYYNAYSDGKHKFSFSQGLGVFKFQKEPF